MRKLSSASCTIIAILAMASTVGCHRATETAPVATTATVVTPATSDATGKSGTAGTTGSGMGGAKHGGSATHGAATSTMAAKPSNSAMPPAPGLKNNSGETQGTTPGTSLPTSDGAR